MKNLLIVIVVVSLFVLNACAQKAKDVPANVQSTFSQKFPTATKVKWEKENDKEWEAEFKLDGIEYSASFNIEGTWLETEHKIKKSEIPTLVKNTLDTQFEGYKIEEPEIIESADGTFYEFELEKGKLEIEVQIDSNGLVVKKESEDEGERDEDDD
ncbi:MAG: PepSY-like domain-containing protein [Bacteroidales bacterium]|nr:PepSY-like domain-containing protein [Bacteroidales bacterium]MCF8455130.1 PepSY-like domain-containing protein [Bacteroidales bacterium]